MPNNEVAETQTAPIIMPVENYELGAAASATFPQCSGEQSNYFELFEESEVPRCSSMGIQESQDHKVLANITSHYYEVLSLVWIRVTQNPPYLFGT
jgi:hypothetical protein